MTIHKTVRRASALDSVDQIYEEQHQKSARTPAFKTVEMFASLMDKRLWLKDARIPSNDGSEILVPFNNPFFYTAVEHELAHILFESNPIAKTQFTLHYIGATNAALKSNKLELNPDEVRELRSLIDHTIGVIEDARVASLWQQLYRGSAILMREMHRAAVKPDLRSAHRSLEAFFICYGSDPEGTPEGKFSPYGPLLDHAKELVAQRTFTTTLVATKWLLVQVVDLTMQRAKVFEGEGTGPGASTGAPKPASAAERTKALQSLLDHDGTPAQLQSVVGDWFNARETSPEAQRDAQEITNEAFKQSLEGTALSTFTQTATATMQARIAEVMSALVDQMSVDDLMARRVRGAMTTADIKRGPPQALGEEDARTVTRLRSTFYRVMNRKRFALRETGSSLDISAYIEGRASNQLLPCFREEENGRGFKILLLVDRSASMKGKKTTQAERACRILAEALRFPFVDFHVWGFTSSLKGVLQISRFNNASLNFESKDAPKNGFTPLHGALQAAGAFMKPGNDTKHIVVITDGRPALVSKEGEEWNERTLMRFTREEVQFARRERCNVTSLMIGKDTTEGQMNFMWGSRKYWQRVDPAMFGASLVRNVASTFTQFLKNG